MWKVRKMQMPFQKFKCPYCERMIAGPQKHNHKSKCKMRIYKAPIQELTYGEAKEAGRLIEFLKR